MGNNDSNNLKNKLYKDLILIFIMGVLYMVLEGFWRGWAHISMVIVGGLATFLIGKLNEHPKFYDRKMWQQCVIGTYFNDTYIRVYFWNDT